MNRRPFEPRIGADRTGAFHVDDPDPPARQSRNPMTGAIEPVEDDSVDTRISKMLVQTMKEAAPRPTGRVPAHMRQYLP